MKHTFAGLIVAIRDDFCLRETISEMFSQGVSRVIVVSPRCYWSDGRPQSEADLEAVRQICAETGAAFAQVALDPDEKSAHPQFGALYDEARCRNCGLDMLTVGGSVDAVAIVDADELWTTGLLEQVDAALENGRAVSAPCIPVVGVPGLPVKNAKDKALVAVRTGLEFDWGRSVGEVRRVDVTAPVYHFSMTRRTAEEVVDKARQSAHYRDPSYDFEGWLAKKFPRIKPGMTDAHMYVCDSNIWPEVRAWEPAELEALPPSLLPYLG